MNLKNKKLTVALSLILVLALSSAGGYYGYNYYQDQTKSEQDQDTYNPDENTNPNPSTNPDLDGNETEEWLTYTDPDFGFSFEYPKFLNIEREKQTDRIYITLSETNIELEIAFLNSPIDQVGRCSGVLTKQQFNNTTSIDFNNTKLYRPKAENWLTDEDFGYLSSAEFFQIKEIISEPPSTYPDAYATYTCLIPFKEKTLNFQIIFLDKKVNAGFINISEKIIQTIKWN